MRLGITEMESLETFSSSMSRPKLYFSSETTSTKKKNICFGQAPLNVFISVRIRNQYDVLWPFTVSTSRAIHFLSHFFIGSVLLSHSLFLVRGEFRFGFAFDEQHMASSFSCQRDEQKNRTKRKRRKLNGRKLLTHRPNFIAFNVWQKEYATCSFSAVNNVWNEKRTHTYTYACERI